MQRPRSHLTILALTLAASACGGARAGGPAPQPGAGCCRELTTMLEASVFRIDVMRLWLRVDDATASAVHALVSRMPRSPVVDNQVAALYLGSRGALVRTEFLMAMSGGTFVDNTVKAFRGMVRDSVLTVGEMETLAGEARTRFAFLGNAGVRPGDSLEYAVSGDTVKTSYTRAGRVLMRDQQVGEHYRRVLLASYFAPSSDFRRGLLDQVFTR